MTEAEYKACLKLIDNKYEQDKKDLQRDYAFSNNPYSVGDKVTDHVGTIIVEKLKYSPGSYGELPSCVYYGTELTKAGTPSKRRDNKRHVYQSNIGL